MHGAGMREYTYAELVTCPAGVSMRRRFRLPPVPDRRSRVRSTTVAPPPGARTLRRSADFPVWLSAAAQNRGYFGEQPS